VIAKFGLLSNCSQKLDKCLLARARKIFVAARILRFSIKFSYGKPEKHWGTLHASYAYVLLKVMHVHFELLLHFGSVNVITFCVSITFYANAITFCGVTPHFLSGTIFFGTRGGAGHEMPRTLFLKQFKSSLVSFVVENDIELQSCRHRFSDKIIIR